MTKSLLLTIVENAVATKSIQAVRAGAVELQQGYFFRSNDDGFKQYGEVNSQQLIELVCEHIQGANEFQDVEQQTQAILVKFEVLNKPFN